MSLLRVALLALAIGLAVCALGVTYQLRYGVSARDEPTRVEAVLARWLRTLAIPRGARLANNPVPATQATLAEARAHFADHCAICHANDGSGNTQIGRNLYPKAPDMRQARTQSLSDGELFYIIHNGVRLTGMPAWGKGDPDPDSESWKLVHFIRHLPHLGDGELAEMRRMNPKTRHDLEEEDEIRRFLGNQPQKTRPEVHRH